MNMILLDIEGTTTSVSFVHETLFSYAREHMEDFVRENHRALEMKAALQSVAVTLETEGKKADTIDDRIDALKRWIDEDRKHPALKKIQGQIWKKGYEDGAYRAHLYDDVLPKLREWRGEGVLLGIYSSGSVQAQKLLFAHTEHGDLTELFSYWFDTAMGAKRDVGSYRNIAKQLAEREHLQPAEILFLSDVEGELDAAEEAGFATIQLVRPGTKASEKHKNAPNFTEISL